MTGETLSLYRKYRPQRFGDLVGQDMAAQGLRNAVQRDAVKHAYLFTGPAGTGKTTSARVFAAAINCDAPQDGEPCGECGYCTTIFGSGEFTGVVYEINAASHRGIDAVRSVIQGVDTGSLGKKKVYIWDEAHSLTTDASNALLKVLEEPPPNVVFIFATTEENKILPTIQSRTTKIGFKTIGDDVLMGLVKRVSELEGFDLTEQQLHSVVIRGGGSARTALSYLESAALGVEDNRQAGLVDIIEASQNKDISTVLLRIAQLETAGDLDPRFIATKLLSFWRDALVYQQNSDLISVTDEMQPLVEKAAKDSPTALVSKVEAMARCLHDMRATSERVVLEATLCRIVIPSVSRMDPSVALSDLVDRFSTLETMVGQMYRKMSGDPAVWEMPESVSEKWPPVSIDKPSVDGVDRASGSKKLRREIASEAPVQPTDETVDEEVEDAEEEVRRPAPAAVSVEEIEKAVDDVLDALLHSEKLSSRDERQIDGCKIEVEDDGAVVFIVKRALSEAGVKTVESELNDYEIIWEVG